MRLFRDERNGGDFEGKTFNAFFGDYKLYIGDDLKASLLLGDKTICEFDLEHEFTSDYEEDEDIDNILNKFAN